MVKINKVYGINVTKPSINIMVSGGVSMCNKIKEDYIIPILYIIIMGVISGTILDKIK